MTADELRSRVYHYVGSVLQRSDEIRCAKRVVYNDDGVVAVGNLCYLVDVGHTAVRVAERLYDNSFSVGLECCVNFLEVGRVYYGQVYALCGQRVGNEVVGAAVEVVGCDDVVSVLCHIL